MLLYKAPRKVLLGANFVTGPRRIAASLGKKRQNSSSGIKKPSRDERVE